ncbi:MAG: pyridoxal phosphate-dependent aminotransferase family protein [Caldilineaceae bacterium]|nr:pyridoxal phosphate-dependent aminotransferase family protein [Caldilineaceae bacterium]MBP8109889.1 pyridoxal phosphate-dependent aminotransferase family protein [Caldilineaceae bacterium]MBP8123477.1 pyridoxal phosphate-dependent aminotransferase family protein [Caldilineaceae bacterium]MBP9074864.1 pyridoxal phosphate-dependent aminotransferase family protein [Caldilineaceae bacterium]
MTSVQTDRITTQTLVQPTDSQNGTDSTIQVAAPTAPAAQEKQDGFTGKIDGWWDRIAAVKAQGTYYYFQPVDELDGPWVYTEGQRKLMFATYSYLGLLNHPRVVAAAKAALDKYGAGTHGVRILGGTLDLHDRMEKRIADFMGREDAIVYATGYVTNLATVSTLVGRGDWVISDKWNHASIVDGCVLARGEFRRFHHNDMEDLERILAKAPAEAGKLVVADAVFSMDGDIFDLPAAVALCRKYNARLMMDEAHSLGVLGATGRGIEEHFNMPGSVDIKMGTLSKTIPGVGGYIAGDARLINFLRHTARGFVFSAALPPAVAAAILEAFNVIEDEGVARNKILRRNVDHFIGGLKAAGFDTGVTVTPIVPIMVGDEERAMIMTKYCQDRGVFVLPVLPPAVAEGAARLRANVTAAHSVEDIDFALDVFIGAGKLVGLI